MTVTIDTSTYATASAYSNQKKLVRLSQDTLVAVNASTGTNAEFWYSTDNGSTWAQFTAGTSDIAGWSNGSISSYIDSGGTERLVAVWRQSGTGGGRTNGEHYCMVGAFNSARTTLTWSAALDTGIGSSSDYFDLVTCADGTGGLAMIALSFANGSVTQAVYEIVSINSSGTATLVAGPALLGGSYTSATPGSFPSVCMNPSTKDIYVAWSAGATGSGYGIRFRKGAYSSGTWTLGAEREIDNTRYIDTSARWLRCLFDGTRVIIAGEVYDGANYDIIAHERDAADTTTTTRVLVDNAATTARIDFGSASYNGSGNLYFFGVNQDQADGSKNLVYRVWTRATTTLAAQVVVDATVGDAYVNAKVGYSNSLIEFIYRDLVASPYNIKYSSISLNVAPNAPTLSSPVGGQVVDLAITQRASWVFSDPDAGDSQSAFDLQYRVVGAGSWTTVSSTTPNNYYDFAPSIFTAGNYEWQVRTYDALGVVGPYSASSFFTAANAPALPTITTPTSGATVSAAVSFTWSAPSQTDFQVRKVADLAGSPDTGTIYYDSGDMVDAVARVLTLAFSVNGRYEHLQVRVKYAGLWSSWASVRVLASYTPPLTPTLVATPSDATGSIVIAITNSPVNLLPAADASLEVGLGTWVANANCSVTQSTTQALDGTHSLRLSSTAAGDMSAKNTAIAVSPSTQYTALTSFRAGASARSCRVTIQWLTAAMAAISTSVGTSVADTTTGWTQVFVTATSPSNAAFAYIVPEVVSTGGASELHYADEIDLHQGATTTFNAGGTPAVIYNDIYLSSSVEIEYRAAANLALNSSWTFWTPVSGRVYTPRIVAVGNNGTTASS